MAKPAEDAAPQAGDVIEVDGHTLRDARRLGQIIEVVGPPDHPHYRVRWEDGHESVFYPGAGTRIRPRAERRR